MAGYWSMAAWMAFVSSVTPSPFAPRDLRLTQVSITGKSGMSFETGAGKSAATRISWTVLNDRVCPKTVHLQALHEIPDRIDGAGRRRSAGRSAIGHG